MVLSDPLTTAQFHSRAQGAADRIERDSATIQDLAEMIRLLTEKGVKQSTGLGWNERLRMARDARIRALGGEG
jgi:hypothetical protein